VAKKDFLKAFGFLFAQEIALNAPKNTGEMAQAFISNFEVVNDEVVYKVPEYTKFVEFGTSPHVIYPKNGKALKFNIAGKDIFVKKVNHPGTTPKPFIRHTINTKLQSTIKKTIRLFE